MFKQVDNQETALTSANEDFRGKVLGYTGEEGVFQREDFMDNFRGFLDRQL